MALHVSAAHTVMAKDADDALQKSYELINFIRDTVSGDGRTEFVNVELVSHSIVKPKQDFTVWFDDLEDDYEDGEDDEDDDYEDYGKARGKIPNNDVCDIPNENMNGVPEIAASAVSVPVPGEEEPPQMDYEDDEDDEYDTDTPVTDDDLPF